ncbi:hypothetical protein [Psychrobacillus psychrotolerans]|uniref:hypothetical protein n=1 Tax=Psychrobacillus psychrotolerans TaxID=126156 RepID=UPI003B028E7F
MPFIKPLPEWQATGTEPPLSLKQMGWQMGVKPPSDYFNYLQNRSYEALKELQEKAGEVKTVNNQAPDINGNINVNVDTSTLATKEELTTHLADYIKHPAYGITKSLISNQYAVDIEPSPTIYTEGMGLVLRLTATSSAVDSISVNINGLGGKALRKANGNTLNNLKAGGIYSFRYSTLGNGGAGAFILQGEGGEYGNAGPNDVRVGKTFGTEEGIKQGTFVGYGIGDEIPIEKLDAPLGYMNMPRISSMGAQPSTQYHKDSLKYDHSTDSLIIANTNIIYKYKANTTAYIGQYTAPGSPIYYLQVDEDYGFIYVDADGRGRNISKMDINFKVLWKTNVTIFSSFYGDLVGNAPGNNGVAAAESSNSYVWRWNKDGGLVWGGYQGIADTYNLCLTSAPNGDVYVAVQQSNSIHKIYKFDGLTGVRTEVTLNSIQLNPVIKLRFNKVHNRLIVIFQNSGMQVRAASNMGLQYSYSGITNMKNAEVDNEGNIYVTSGSGANAVGGMITKFSHSLSILSQTIIGLTESVAAIAIDKTPGKEYPDVYFGGQYTVATRSKQTVGIKQ